MVGFRNAHDGGAAKFRHDFYPRPTISRTTTPTMRTYHTPDGDFPSVTTMLKYALDDSGLDAWRDRIGHEEAAKITARAGHRGTAVHSIAEKYLMNDPAWHKDAMPFNLATFYSLKNKLDEAVGTIWGVEFPLWSKRLGIAGTVDLVCEWWNEPAVVDFKTAAKFRGEDSPAVRKYILQAATYAIMTRELLGINITKLVILFSPDDAIAGRTVVRNLEDYAPQVETLFSEKNRSRIKIPAALNDED